MSILQKIKRIGLSSYLDDLSGNSFSYLNYLFHKIIKKPYFGSHLASLQGKNVRHFYMQELIHNYCSKNDIKLLEIGSWAGGSVITWAEALSKKSKTSKIYCIDPWEDYLDNNNQLWTHKTMKNATKKNKIYSLFLHNIITSGYVEMVSILRGKTEDMVKTLKEKSFDVIFIDANHAYNAVKKDLSSVIPLLKDGAILCGDDLELQYSEVNTELLLKSKNMDVIVDPNKKINYHPGVTLAVYEEFRHDISSFKGFWAVQLVDGKWENISLDNTNEIIPSHLI
ncbi:class I SAM-dependent methyltransferase [Sulfurimonas sp.]|uniref:class I SAM-dependent methyltransferase n=1 Tax=Sulfurimonas sp. TaxID=2022749 RepID=UPI00356233A5